MADSCCNIRRKYPLSISLIKIYGKQGKYLVPGASDDAAKLILMVAKEMNQLFCAKDAKKKERNIFSGLNAEHGRKREK